VNDLAQFSVAESSGALPMSQPVMFWIAVAAGVALGFVVALISRIVSARLGKGEFWAELPLLTRRLATGSDSDEFLRVYGRLLKLLGEYLARNAIQLVASFAPVVATVVLCGPAVMESYNLSALALAIHPKQPLTIVAGGERFESSAEGAAIQPIPRGDGRGSAITSAGEFEFASLWHNNAWCTTGWSRVGMTLLGFDAHDSGSPGAFLILRPSCGDSNPLWPYLNDLEFAFYLAIAAASGLTVLFLRKRVR
jgi:hypothetical protein